jgi:hypothetical protein
VRDGDGTGSGGGKSIDIGRGRRRISRRDSFLGVHLNLLLVFVALSSIMVLAATIATKVIVLAILLFGI